MHACVWHAPTPTTPSTHTQGGIAASDACLVDMEEVSRKEYCKLQFPSEYISPNIAHLELLTMIIMCKTGIKNFAGKAVTFNCDNETVVQVLNSGRAQHP